MLEKAAELIKQGKIVVFPTETVYGIGTNGLDEQAVKKLYNVKQRPLNKPISLLVSNMEMVNQIAKDITEIEYKIMEKFFPGPLTIILKKKDIVPDIVTSFKFIVTTQETYIAPKELVQPEISTLSKDNTS